MSHTQLLKTKCELCPSTTVIEMSDYHKPGWKEMWNPPPGWVDISEDAGEISRHVCKDCVDRIVKLRMEAGVAERIAKVDPTPRISDIIGEEP